MPLPNVPARVTRGALVSHRHSFALPRCITSQYCRTLMPFSVSLWNDHSDPVFDGVGLAGFKYFFFHPWVGCVGLGSSD